MGCPTGKEKKRSLLYLMIIKNVLKNVIKVITKKNKYPVEVN